MNSNKDKVNRTLWIMALVVLTALSASCQIQINFVKKSVIVTSKKNIPVMKIQVVIANQGKNLALLENASMAALLGDTIVVRNGFRTILFNDYGDRINPRISLYGTKTRSKVPRKISVPAQSQKKVVVVFDIARDYLLGRDDNLSLLLMYSLEGNFENMIKSDTLRIHFAR